MFRTRLLGDDRVTLALICVAAVSCISPQETVEQRCDKLRQHVVTVRTQSLPEADRAAHAAALDSALVAAKFADECKAFTPAQLECALATTDTVALGSCTGATSSP